MDREGRDWERQGNTGREMGRLRQGERDIGMKGEGEGETEKWRETEGIHVQYTIFCGKSQVILHSWDTITDPSVSKY